MKPNSEPACAGGADARTLIAGTGLVVERSGRILLDHVDIAISRGEIVTVVGLNGAGKTTLVRALLDLTPLTDGQVWRAPGLTVGYVPQRMEIDATLPLTVSRFLRLGVREGGRQVHETLEEVGVAELETASVSALSGGELRRIMLARALMRQPDLLVLDEPMSGIDVAGQAELYALIESIRDHRRCGVLLVSHDLHVVMAATDRVVCLNQHVCCTGHPELIVENPEFHALFGDQAARVMALYHHDHDHHHDTHGDVVPMPDDGMAPTEAN
jgi:zinc transport system ATP-binding protein